MEEDDEKPVLRFSCQHITEQHTRYARLDMIKKVNKRNDDRVKVTFVLPEDHPYGDEVFVVGDFNDWTHGEHRFVRRSNQTFSTNVTVEEGNRYAFRYYSDEHGWINEDEADDYEWNDFGSTNSVVET